ncbi:MULTISPECIES: hypothetical protein [unclassified Streptomyces]|uniref:hypothetical protein n=1 Tax=unclassified Streptomyces TaxID=2593676 RepID=UPI001EEFD3C3|nr:MULTISPECIES: hypothetical protein [unclassified Streptomyces]
MRPDLHTRLYGPWQPAPPQPRTGAALLTGVLWTLTLASLAWLTFLVGIIGVFVAASGEPVGGLLMGWIGCVAGGAAVLTAVAFLPPVRRMATPHRMLLLGALACPVPLVVTIVTWFRMG